jgi:hypothetical protein
MGRWEGPILPRDKDKDCAAELRRGGHGEFEVVDVLHWKGPGGGREGGGGGGRERKDKRRDESIDELLSARLLLISSFCRKVLGSGFEDLGFSSGVWGRGVLVGLGDLNPPTRQMRSIWSWHGLSRRCPSCFSVTSEVSYTSSPDLISVVAATEMMLHKYRQRLAAVAWCGYGWCIVLHGRVMVALNRGRGRERER